MYFGTDLFNIRGAVMIIERKNILKKLISKRENGLIKVITGIRRCGKSFLLFRLYKNYLISDGVNENNIIELSLDDVTGAKYRNPLELDKYIREKASDLEMCYVFIDEIQMVSTIQNPYVDDPKSKIGFVDVLLGFMKMKNLDVYVTGSNSKMLSSDILTEFRGKGDELRVYPLTYSEFYSAYDGDKRYALRDYFTYGGMPFIMSLQSHEEKGDYLKNLFSKTYLADVLDRNKILHEQYVLDDLLNIISSAVGSLTNPRKLADSFRSVSNSNNYISPNTISRYLDYFLDAFILKKACRYDIKGKKYIESPQKYYFTDVGLRNARLNFRQQEDNHIMENIIFNELTSRGFNIDVGVVEYSHRDINGKKVRSQLEVDFVANKGNNRYYVQSAFSIPDEQKRLQEINSLLRIPDSFKKIVIVKDDIIPWYDENGIFYIGIEEFLLDEDAMRS